MMNKKGQDDLASYIIATQDSENNFGLTKRTGTFILKFGSFGIFKVWFVWYFKIWFF